MECVRKVLFLGLAGLPEKGNGVYEKSNVSRLGWTARRPERGGGVCEERVAGLGWSAKWPGIETAKFTMALACYMYDRIWDAERAFSLRSMALSLQLKWHRETGN